MTEKRPTLTLKPKAPAADSRRGRPGGKGAGPARPGGPQAGKGAGTGNAGGRPQGGRQQDGQGAPRGPGGTAPRGTQRVEPAPRDAGYAQTRPDDGPRVRHSHEVKTPAQLDYRPALREDSLAFALLGAASSLARVRAGTALPQALAEVAQAWDAPPQARGAMQDIAYRAMRQLGRSGILLGLMTSKAPEPAMLAGLLECALALLDPPEGSEPPYEAFTVVDQAVGAAAAHPDFAHAKAMVNAVLRRFLRERELLLVTALRDPVAQWNYPQWWIDAVRTAYPGDWQSILTAGNRQPPLTLRVNRRK
ncbi:MAG TPA: hypothetical protein VFK72_01545, partial [Nevskia sp.]|nr:hypothetical protein [Nevskia sp.]